MVRVTTVDTRTNETIYSVRYPPDVARILAQTLTLNAIQIEDGN